MQNLGIVQSTVLSLYNDTLLDTPEVFVVERCCSRERGEIKNNFSNLETAANVVVL